MQPDGTTDHRDGHAANEGFLRDEREGAEIARQLVHALLDSGVKVAYLTHMYELAHLVCSRPGSAKMATVCRL
jgi:hypothetical protein